MRGRSVTTPARKDSDAGASAMEQVALIDDAQASLYRQIRSLTQAAVALQQSKENFSAGAAGERRTADRVRQILDSLASTDWHLLPDRRWPGTRKANLDLVLVGPPGVVVLDAKNWHEPRIVDGSLWRGEANADEEVEKSRAAGDAVAASLADSGLAPTAVHPVVMLVGKDVPACELAGVTVVGESGLEVAMARLGVRLRPEQVTEIAAAVEQACPPAAKHRAAAAATAVTPPSEATQEPLLDLEAVWEALVEQAAQEPIESWMTWLHPEQAHLVSRSYNGPARIRGAAGTGKTVVALHRARHLARTPGARVLVTSYVRTLPVVHARVFARLAPELGKRVEFRGLHSWAVRLLRSRGRAVDVAGGGGRWMFDQAFREADTAALDALTLPADYWWDEVQHVIKGRGLGDFADYRELTRVGRRYPLREEQRRALWNVVEDYEDRLQRSEKCDWSDVLIRALAEVHQDPPADAYSAVVVDEVQDLTRVGLQLAHALVGDVPDGLLLVGDGQQQVYPGGFSLAEAGVSVQGRAAVLDRNYRNRAEVLRVALESMAGESFEDLEAGVVAGVREVETAHDGGLVKRAVCHDQRSQRAALLSALDWARHHDVRTGDMAILLRDNASSVAWVKELQRAGVPAELLKDYDGTGGDEVKVGTYQRAKGLEFACVFLPDSDRAVPDRRPEEPDEAYEERVALARRQLFVAMTRARDRLWLGSLG